MNNQTIRPSKAIIDDLVKLQLMDIDANFCDVTFKRNKLGEIVVGKSKDQPDVLIQLLNKRERLLAELIHVISWIEDDIDE